MLLYILTCCVFKLYGSRNKYFYKVNSISKKREKGGRKKGRIELCRLFIS